MVEQLRLVEVSKYFPGGRSGRQVAVSNLSLTAESGTVLALLGPNGAGKTTTVKMCCNLIIPSSGTIFIRGQDIAKHPSVVGHSVGAVLEGSRNLFWRWTVTENLTYFAGLRGVTYKQIQQNIHHLAERLSFSPLLDRPVQTLSRGNQQRVALASSLMAQPSLLLLDEPTLGLDFDSQLAVKEEIKSLAAAGCTILLTTHQLDLAAALSDMVGMIVNGELVAFGRQADILKPLMKRAGGYRLILSEPASADARQILDNWEAKCIDNGCTYDVYIPESPDVYRFMASLQPHALRIKSLQETTPDLVDAYLSYVRREQP